MTAVDLRYRIIPNRVVLPAAAIGYAISVASHPDAGSSSWSARSPRACSCSSPRWRRPAGLGMGDVKLALMLGAFLGRGVSVAIMGGLLAAALPSIGLLCSTGAAGGR